MWPFKKVISQGVKDIAKNMIEHPEDWVQGMNYFSNKNHRDISIWTANGWYFIKFEGNTGLNTEEKIYLNNAIKQSIANKLSVSIKNMKTEKII